MFSVQKQLVVYKRICLFQGVTEKGNHFKAVSQAAFNQNLTKFLQLMDDFLLHGPTEQQ